MINKYLDRKKINGIPAVEWKLAKAISDYAQEHIAAGRDVGYMCPLCVYFAWRNEAGNDCLEGDFR